MNDALTEFEIKLNSALDLGNTIAKTLKPVNRIEDITMTDTFLSSISQNNTAQSKDITNFDEEHEIGRNVSHNMEDIIDVGRDAQIARPFSPGIENTLESETPNQSRFSRKDDFLGGLELGTGPYDFGFDVDGEINLDAGIAPAAEEMNANQYFKNDFEADAFTPIDQGSIVFDGILNMKINSSS
jgi:hypothetical protein